MQIIGASTPVPPSIAEAFDSDLGSPLRRQEVKSKDLWSAVLSSNVIDRWALEEIVKKRFPLHEQDLAKLVKDHFSDVLQQIEDRDKMTGEDSSEDDGEENA